MAADLQACISSLYGITLGWGRACRRHFGGGTEETQAVAPDDGATLASCRRALQQEFAALFTLTVFSKLTGVFTQMTALLQPECRAPDGDNLSPAIRIRRFIDSWRGVFHPL